MIPEPYFPLDRPARLAVLASGRGSNLKALLEAFPPENELGSVVLVVSDKAESGALELARAADVQSVHILWSSRREFEEELEEALTATGIDLICLAGFMRILSARFVGLYEGRILNIHPSLLPDFPGLNPQRRALEAGRTVSGCTVHFVDAGVDTGPPVLACEVPVISDDDENTLSDRILRQEHITYPEAVRLVLSGQIRS